MTTKTSVVADLREVSPPVCAPYDPKISQWKMWQNIMLVSPIGLAPRPTRNHGSTSAVCSVLYLIHGTTKIWPFFLFMGILSKAQ